MPGAWVALAGAAIGAAGSISAADTQANAADNATANSQAIYRQNQANLQPYMQQGNAAGTQLSSMLQPGGQLTSNFTGADYLANQDPGYAFQLNQGQQALQNSQAAGNGVLSGSSLKDLISYNQGAASTGYQNAFNRWQTQNNNVYNRLLGTTQLGENAAAGAGNTGATIGSSIANTITGAGNASASGIVGASNAVNSGLGNGYGYYQLNQMLNNGSSSATTGSSTPYTGADTGADFENLG